MLAIAQLPLAYGPGERHDGDIARFDAAVSELDAWFTGSRVALAERALATRQPFYIAYQDADIRPSLDRYGDLCVRLMTQSHGHAVVARRERPRPVRVAVVSRFFYDHAVWTALLRGWCSRVDRSRIELHFLHTGTHDDAHTALARTTAASFTRGPRSVGQWMEVMRDIAPDIAIYPEVCMDAMSLRLACVRPAPVQVTTWGHPMTSGLSTIDHFLSAQAFEPDGAQAHYRERLVELPGIGCYYDRLAPDELAGDASILGPRTRPRFACVGTPYKYLPQHDHLLVDIAGRVGDCEFLFFVDMAPLLSRKVEDRLALAFAQRGLEAKRFLRFLPRQTRPTFFAILRACDAYLDTPVFSGFNTAMQAVECGLPIVTREGRYLRGRFASGILGEMGVGDVVAHDDEQYVATAARLATDPRYRDSICARMEAGSRRVFCNEAPVRALEDFLAGLASRGAD
jgi:predicted O-linked N-acetylglucosamine transferase (SPINDLY family)